MIVARMEPGEDILATIGKIADSYKIQSGSLTLIGAVSRAHLGYFDRKSLEYKSFTLEEDLEVVSGMGNISRLRDNSVVVHTHIIVSDEKGKCYGGHLMPGCEVSVTIELVIHEMDANLRRAKDKLTGLNLLDLK
jgi:predicted DNA-binding protein with PD1-like motif